MYDKKIISKMIIQFMLHQLQHYGHNFETYWLDIFLNNQINYFVKFIEKVFEILFAVTRIETYIHFSLFV